MRGRHEPAGELLVFARAAMRVLLVLNAVLVAAAWFQLDELVPFEDLNRFRHSVIFLAFGLAAALLAAVAGRRQRHGGARRWETVHIVATIAAAFLFFIGSVTAFYFLTSG